MITNILLLLSALALSAIAGYYSVLGMTAIFAAAWWPVVIMTGTLEFSKIVVASWLYKNWSITPKLLKSYLTISVLILMFITSLGIFGFLSKAHIDQTLGIGDTGLLVSEIDQQVQVERGKIEDNRNVIKQMDDAVTSMLAQSTAASTQKANRGGSLAQQSAKLRATQKKDRDLLNKSIDDSNAKIRELNSQKLKLEQNQLKLEAEVGPIKYIAQMVYGDNPDKNLLEKAVRYVIILIIFVFDPLAVLMIIAANMSFMIWGAERQKKKDDKLPATADNPIVEQETVSSKIHNDMTLAGLHAMGPIPVTPVYYTVPANKEEFATNATNNNPEPVKSESNIALANQTTLIVELTPEMPEDLPVAQDFSLQPESSVNVENKIPEEISGVDKIEIKKSDDILQTIKQYHSVRLDDAKRTMR